MINCSLPYLLWYFEIICALLSCYLYWVLALNQCVKIQHDSAIDSWWRSDTLGLFTEQAQ